MRWNWQLNPENPFHTELYFYMLNILAALTPIKLARSLSFALPCNIITAV